MLKGALSGVAAASVPSLSWSEQTVPVQRKGRIKQSVSRWCYKEIPLDKLCAYSAQIGLKAPKAKPLRGFGGAGVLEVVEDFDGDTFRAVYTVKFRGIVFVLHVFQKKSKRGIRTPKADIELIKSRLKSAEDAYRELYQGDTNDK